MRYLSSCRVLAIVAALIVSMAPTCAHAQSVRQWTGYVEYESDYSSRRETDSNWLHAMAVKLPTSHKSTTIVKSRSAIFVLNPGNTISVDQRFTETDTTDIDSQAEIQCRAKTGRFNTHLSRRRLERTVLSGSGRTADGRVSVSFNEKTGEYLIAVDVPELRGVKAILSTESRESSGCDSKPPTPRQERSGTMTISGYSAAGKGSIRVEPDRPIILSGSVAIGESEKLTWNLSSDPDVPPVAIHGPYTPVRGDEVTFDGTRSLGRNLKYKWIFHAGVCSDDKQLNEVAGQQAVLKEVTLDGPVVKATLLCDTEVTLEVSDGKRTDSMTRTVTVKPREWKTEVARGPRQYFGKGIFMDADGGAVHFSAGANRCAIDGDLESENHYIHPGRKKWDGELYRLKKVKDGGPFNGIFYVELLTNPMQVHRMSWINADLLPTSRFATENAKDRQTRRDFDTLALQVEAHEQIHTTLLEESVRAHDYAKEIEPLFGANREGLNAVVMRELYKAETALAESTWDERVAERMKSDPQFNKKGVVRVPVGGAAGETFGDWFIGNYAELGLP